MSKNSGGKFLKTLLCAAVFSGAASQLAAADPSADPSRRTIRFVQDDAQDYMVSKIYRLKYVQSNDITPFLMGIVMRYNMNSSVGAIEYGANNSQMITVTCPVKMMPYVDDFVAKADRNIKIDGKQPGDIIRGTGITRAVYQPKYRSGQALLNVLVNSVIGEGPYSSVYAWDANSNQIYWKDNVANTEYVYQFLGYLDRPAPQIQFEFTLHEVRESTLRDIGIEYLAWKNGPGLNIFQTAFKSFSITSAGSSALQGMSGPLGAFFVAPQFDASFIRLLQQNGKASINSTASVAVQNETDRVFSVSFAPEYQNITKDEDHRSDVTVGGDSTLTATISAVTVINPVSGVVNFNYSLNGSNVVERNNLGTEITEGTSISSSVTLDFKNEKVLASWERTSRVDQTIGIPFLCELPVLRYIFGTTTTNIEKTRYIVTARAVLLKYDKNVVPGVVKEFDELVKK